MRRPCWWLVLAPVGGFAPIVDPRRLRTALDAQRDQNTTGPNDFWKRTLFSVVTAAVMVTSSLPPAQAWSGPPLPLSTTTETIPRPRLNRLRYWTILGSDNVDVIAAANIALMDHAVGTINTMYYDPSGGVDFEPHDFYRQWRQYVTTHSLTDRASVVEGLRWLVGQLHDPYSRYLTREELEQELSIGDHGFWGLGAMVEDGRQPRHGAPLLVANLPTPPHSLSVRQVINLPVVTAVAPESPAERAGVTVGDRVVSVGGDVFLGRSPALITKRLADYPHTTPATVPDLVIAKPIYRGAEGRRDVVVGFRPTRVRLEAVSTPPLSVPAVHGGDAVVKYELMTDHDSIFNTHAKVGYIRLTRFSKAATAGFVAAVDALEAAGANAYIIDLRNNYGGVIQEAMLTASALLRDPHAVLAYTLNSRGGFTPHDVEEYVVDRRYPGYRLSSESPLVTLKQVKREAPELFEEDGIMWVPPSSFASLHEQTRTRGLHRTADLSSHTARQKKIVVLVNEGTASSAEVFASALHDNGRTVALVGSRTYGKGLIQHNFPMPDGGCLRLTVAEYLTPALRHVTHVGGANFDPQTGERLGGGLEPDIRCVSQIPSNTGADLCVGVALDALESAGPVQRVGGAGEGVQPRRPVVAGVVKVSCCWAETVDCWRGASFFRLSQDDF